MRRRPLGWPSRITMTVMIGMLVLAILASFDVVMGGPIHLPTTVPPI